ncbi:FAD-dependent oxidoreductase, partial [Microbacterium schleiferi]
MLDTRLTKESRDRALARLSESSRPGRELDVLVIGGGITGAGIALDAASRGLETVVVEAQDWGAGTSSRSSKLVHGGLRYLQMLDFKLVFEALAERDLLLTTVAPHLVRPVPFLYPLRHRVWERAFVGAGIALYDVLATLRRGKRALP